MAHNLFESLKEFELASGARGRYYALPALERAGIGRISRLPVSIRIVLESVLRNCDGKKITEEHVRRLANWSPTAERTDEIPFVVSRVVLQDFTGVPLLCDLAAMRNVAADLGRDPKLLEPLVPVDLVVDHSVMIDYYGSHAALDLNMKREFDRNAERYQFMKWGMQAFDTFKVVPPGIGIVHQVNLEYLAPGVHVKDGLYYPDTLVGTDSHTTMINGIGVVGWGVGGIEAEAGMLGQPVYFLTPDVVGVELAGRLPEGATATDLVLTVTEMLRREKVVGKFVEFFGEGTASLSVPDRATIGNMSPEYGATMGFFPVDDKTVAYLRATGRSEDALDAFERYFKSQNLFGMPRAGDIDYTKMLRLDLASVVPSVAGPKRPQDRIALPDLSTRFAELFSKPGSENGFSQPADRLRQRHKTLPMVPGRGQISDTEQQLPRSGLPLDYVEMVNNRPTTDRIATQSTPQQIDIGNGDVLIAAITSCTNTSNPSVLLAAGLLAKKAVEKGLTVKPHIKTSLAPGSRVVTDYLTKTELLPYLDKLGFDVAAYGCTTCIGNAGDLAPEINDAIASHDLVCAAVLSGNRNFEARIHPNLKANFLMSPPLVVAYAIAGSVLRDIVHEPLGQGRDGPVFLRDIWPTSQEVDALLSYARDPATFRRLYGDVVNANPMWATISGSTGQVYDWPPSTYIAKPPFFEGFTMTSPPMSDIRGARVLGIFGDSVTTDHISPAGSIKPTSPAGIYLQEKDVSVANFNSYGARRGNHEVMLRGTFGNVRIKNLMLPARNDGTRIEGGVTLYYGKNGAAEQMPIYDAAMRYQKQGIPSVVFGGEEYGTGSSRDWAAKGTQLLGIKAVIAKSFERIHRSNLVGMGVLPLQFMQGDGAETLRIKGDETFDISVPKDIKPQQRLSVTMRSSNGTTRDIPVICRIDTPIEVDYYRHGGILPFVLRDLLQPAA
ncbi:MAG TPA: aconitate hydratase [Casimicrobiaceae bacterium]|nr:aconitate hydratase [Casimicrobiaceae bacterium]